MSKFELSKCSDKDFWLWLKTDVLKYQLAKSLKPHQRPDHRELQSVQQGDGK